MWRAFMMILAIAAVVAAVSAANLLREPGSVALDWQLVKPLPVEVIVEAPARGPIVQTVTAPGKVESVEEAEIAYSAHRSGARRERQGGRRRQEG